MDHDDDKIIKIIPAPCWRAVYFEDEGEPYEDPLACFALTASGEVFAVTNCGGYFDIEGGIGPNGAINFYMFLGPGQEITEKIKVELVRQWHNSKKKEESKKN